MNNIIIREITNKEEAKSVWDKLSPNDTYGNTWLFREMFNNITGYPISFYTAFEKEEPVALLPLEYKTDKGYFTFFGGMHFEDNELFLAKGNEHLIPELIKELKKPYFLTWMKSDLNNLEGVTHFEDRYELPLEGLTSKEDYIEKYWHGKSKSKLRKKTNKLLENSEVIYDNFDLDIMAELNRKRFGEESSFNNSSRLEYLKQLSKLPNAHSITIKINGKIESSGFALLYNDVYVGLNSGTNNAIDNLGKLIALLKIDHAIKLNAKTYDTRGGELNWKSRFGLTPVPQYKYSNIND